MTRCGWTPDGPDPAGHLKAYCAPGAGDTKPRTRSQSLRPKALAGHFPRLHQVAVVVEEGHTGFPGVPRTLRGRGGATGLSAPVLCPHAPVGPAAGTDTRSRQGGWAPRPRGPPQPNPARTRRSAAPAPHVSPSPAPRPPHVLLPPRPFRLPAKSSPPFPAPQLGAHRAQPPRSVGVPAPASSPLLHALPRTPHDALGRRGSSGPRRRPGSSQAGRGQVAREALAPAAGAEGRAGRRRGPGPVSLRRPSPARPRPPALRAALASLRRRLALFW